MTKQAATSPGPTTTLYDAAYYTTYYAVESDTIPYERSDHWLRFFGGIAEEIRLRIGPSSSFDAGCAWGFLVEALFDRGVDAYGMDISEYAISQAHDSVKDRCVVGSITEQFSRKYDLITCIEVLEHLEHPDAVGAVANLCAHTDDILFSSTPSDYLEPTHVNVQPPEYWAELFARNGFVRDLDFDATFLCPWAVRFRRRDDPMPRVIADYERQHWLFRQERTARNKVIDNQLVEIAGLRAELDGLADYAKRIQRLESSISESQGREVELVRTAHELGSELDRLVHSRSMRVARKIAAVAQASAPAGSARRRAIGKAGRGTKRKLSQLRRQPLPETHSLPDTKPQARYHQWLRQTQPTPTELFEQRNTSGSWLERPMVSVCVPVFNATQTWLEEAVASVRSQSYDNWELCITDDKSTDPTVRPLLERMAKSDPRIRLALRDQNGGISAATNTCLELASGEFVALLDNDDILAPQALFAAVSYLQDSPKTDLFYCDEDILLPSGERGFPFFKPDWSPQTLLSLNYITHFVIARRAIVEAVGGFRSEFDGGQDHDLLLRLTEHTQAVHHIADVLYTWRQSPGSAATGADAKPWAYAASVAAVGDALKRRGLDADVQAGPFPGASLIRYKLPPVQPKVSIVIPTRDRVDLLRACIESIEQRSTYGNYDITIVDNDSRNSDTLSYFASSPYKVVACPGAFNYSLIVNRGVAATAGDYVITLNNDTVVETPDWIEALVELCDQPGVGAVGCRLVRPGGSVQHVGISVQSGRGPINVSMSLPEIRFVPQMQVTRDVTAVTGACSISPRAAWDAVGGLDEQLEVAFNDVDYCLRLRAAGYRVLYTPLVTVQHAESASRGGMHPAADQTLFATRWKTVLEAPDPFMSPHIEVGDQGWVIKLPHEV